ncbi:receptor-type tyrosine- phosphatase epsilon-like, partial [Paramuricea clavata]
IHPGGITENTIEFVLKEFTNKSVRIYQIIVLEVKDGQLRDVNVRVTRYYENRTKGEPYITAEFKAEDFKKHEKFIVGDGQSLNARRRRKRAADNIRNGPLNAGSTYRLLQRGLDDKRNVIETGEWTEEISTPERIVPPNGTSSVGVIVGVVVAVILIIVIVLGVFLYLKRRKVEESKPFVAADGPANHGFQSGEVIAMSDFSEHCRILAADSNYLYSHEYSQIPRKNASLTMHHAQNQVNREKNRYNNILCYDSTRVILKTDPTGNDYVNASRLDGFEKEKAYIASQGPLENTCEDFWRMVWENVTSTVVMVTGLEEGRKIKCHQYWPSTGSMEYGPFVVTLLEQIELTDYTIRTFTVSE